MTSNEIADFIGTNALLRKFAYIIIHLTTLREWYLRRELVKILTTMPPDFKFLDAGSGFGQHSCAIARKYPAASVLGIDIEKQQVNACNKLARAQKLTNLMFLEADLINLNDTNAFDSILCGSVLEHIEQDEQLLAKFRQALKIGGYLLVYVPIGETRVIPALERKMQKIKSGKKYLHQHVRYYSMPEMIGKLKSHGFSIEKVTVTYGAFGKLAYDIVTWIQYSKAFKYIFPIYLVVIHPFVMLLMLIDFIRVNPDGNGLMILARKVIRKCSDIHATGISR